MSNTNDLPALPERGRRAQSDVDRLALVLLEAWKKAEPDSAVTKYPTSYLATFVDMARAAMAAQPEGRDTPHAAILAALRDNEPLTTDQRSVLYELVASAGLQAERKALTDAQWPKAKDVGRLGDMSPAAHMRVGLDSDNDVYVSVWDENGGGAIEFCTPGPGGGKSSRTRMALIALMVAMEADNAETPRLDWWAQRGIGQPAAQDVDDCKSKHTGVKPTAEQFEACMQTLAKYESLIAESPLLPIGRSGQCMCLGNRVGSNECYCQARRRLVREYLLAYGFPDDYFEQGPEQPADPSTVGAPT